MTKELWIALVNIVVGLVLYFAAKYLAPGVVEDVKFVVVLLQPFVLLLIGHFAAKKITRWVVEAVLCKMGACCKD